jgi:hypothetical protein
LAIRTQIPSDVSPLASSHASNASGPSKKIVSGSAIGEILPA